MKSLFLRTILGVSLLVLPISSVLFLRAQTPATAPPNHDAIAIPASDILELASLVPMLNRPDKPLVLQVGSHVLYGEAHIPDSEYAGPTNTPDGITALRQRVSSVGKNQEIVLYCGCCPWERCPNIRPAYRELKALGFTNVKALHIATNFGTDWVNQGYPVAKGR